MDQNIKKVYITKYALSIGIIETMAEIRGSGVYPKGLAFCKINEDEIKPKYYKGNEFFYDKDDAIKYAEKLRTKKIESWRNEIDKLKNKIIKIKSNGENI